MHSPKSSEQGLVLCKIATQFNFHLKFMIRHVLYEQLWEASVVSPDDMETQLPTDVAGPETFLLEKRQANKAARLITAKNCCYIFSCRTGLR